MSLFSKSDSKFDERIADLTLVDHIFFYIPYLHFRVQRDRPGKEIGHFTFPWTSTLELLSFSHRLTEAQKSPGSITAGGLGDILIPYYWVQD